MREQTPSDVPSLDDFRYWKPEHQQQALDLLHRRQQNPWRPFYCTNPACDGFPHDDWDWNHARADQRPPRWSADWLTWFLSGGRGSGKTRTGAEVTHRVTAKVPRIILIAPTGPDLRETMVEGESGLLATAPPDNYPTWEPSRRVLKWPNGCIAQGFSAEEPDRLRGPQSGFIWADEPAFYPRPEKVWDNALFGLRMKGFPTRIVATSTPLATAWLKALLAEDDTILTRVPTYANLHNLNEVFKRKILDKYEGTRLGKQELHGELLEDVEGALWQWGLFRWDVDIPPLVRIVVAVDPAGTKNKKSDLTGIIVVGIDADNDLWVLADYSGRYSPKGWADRTQGAYEDFAADAIVAETNYGGDMVRHTLESSGYSDLTPRIVEVNSRRGKQIRAEPVVALYEKSRVIHAGERGDLLKMEEEQTSWVPGVGDSPNRVDALVHGITDLAKPIMPAQMADPNKLLGEQWRQRRGHLRAV